MIHKLLRLKVLNTILLLLCIKSFATPFWCLKNEKTERIEEVAINACISGCQNYFQEYQRILFDIPFLIDKYLPKDVPLVIVVPDNLKGVGPLENKAIFIEGARTALAWFKSYEEFLKSHNNSLTIIKESEVDFFKTNYQPYPFDSLVKTAPSILSIEPPWIKKSIVKKTFLITGGAGFIGSHLTKRLLDEGNRIIVLDNLSCCTGQNIKDILHNPDFIFVNHDVSFPFQIIGNVDGVIHGASIPSPADYYKMPRETMAAGLSGTLNTLLISIEHNARYLFLSTSEVYGDPEVHPQIESYAGNVDCRSSRSPYDQSKRGAETLIKLYYEKYHIDARIARIFNTYGPGMRLHDGRVVTNFIAALLENKPITIYGDGTQTRSLCYVDDMVEGLYRLFMHDDFRKEDSIEKRVFNIGNPEEYTINEIADAFQQLSNQYLNRQASLIKIENPDKADPRKRKPDITKARQILNFNPHISFKEGITKTFLYFMNNE